MLHLIRSSLLGIATPQINFSRVLTPGAIKDMSAALLEGMAVTRIVVLRRSTWFNKCVAGLIIVLASQQDVAHAIDRSWDADSGLWSDPANWSPNGVPGLGDVVRLGDIPAIENFDVFLDQNDAVAEMHITDGMTFSNLSHTFSVIGNTYISGLNLVPIGPATAFSHSRIFIQPTPAPVQYSTNDLVVTDEGRVRLEGGTVEVRGILSTDIDSSIYGSGQVRFIDSGGVLLNSGVIDPTGPMAFHVVNEGAIDLDGLGSGQILLDWGGDQLTVNGGYLTDSFGGDIVIDGDAALHMNLDSPWEADSNSHLQIGYPNNGIQTEPSIVGGTQVTLAGEVEVTTGAHARFDADAVFWHSVDLEVSQNGQLETNGITELVGGTLTFGEDANANFDGPTVVQGGVFSTFSNLSSDGAVRFNGKTTYNGNLEVNGIAQQFGDAMVIGNSNLQAGVFDMDGGGNTSWIVNHFLTIEAESIDSTLSNTFDGTIDVNGLFGRLTVNLDGTFAEWTMNGELGLANNLPGVATRLGGSPVRITGELAADGRVRITADTQFASGSETSFADADSEIRLASATHVDAGAVFLDSGTLLNLSTGSLTLEDGATLDQVGLINYGLLEVGGSPGVASVDRFENAADGTWHVEIGGYVAGDEFDRIQVTSGATLLDGTITVDLIDAGNGQFLPQVGDEFTVLTSVGDVMGTFSGDPISIAAGQQFQWEVLYGPHDVTLRLMSMTVPEPSALCLAATLPVFFGIRRRDLL